MKLKVAYTNGQTFYAKSTLNLIQTLNYRIPGAKNDAFIDRIKPISHPTDPAYSAELQIEYACGHDKLIKPYIFVEGFSPIQFQANKTYADYYDDLRDYQNANQSDYQLLDELFENGYDIVYVDFAQGTGDIIKNAEVLAEAIKWVNGEKGVNGSTEPNVVVGYSMGGLIARLGIRYLELDTDPAVTPDVSYYISVDAPHLGVNVPLGIRFAIDDLYNNVSLVSENLGEYEEGLDKAYQVMTSMAASQMLLYSFDSYDIFGGANNTTRVNFVNELNTVGFPTTTIENVAIAKGNAFGAEQSFGSLDPILNTDIQNNYSCFDDLVDIYNLVHFDSDDEIVEYLEGTLNFIVGSLITVLTILGTRADLELDIYALPGHVPESYRIFKRKIQFRILWIIPFHGSSRKISIANAYPFDSCPGSTYSVEDFSVVGDIEPLLNGDHAPCIELGIQDFCFIPTFSALNISSLLTSPYSPIDPMAIVSNNETTFDKAFVLDPSLYPPNSAPTNESHLVLSPSNISPFASYISPIYNAVNENSTVYGYTFNFGYAEDNNVVIKTTDRITHPITISGLVSASGAIWVNRNARLGNVNDTGHPYCDSDHFSVELTRSCNYTFGQITIDEFGSLVIGEDQNKTADLIVRENSWIKMNDGFLEIRQGSRLIIDDGAELRLNGGSLRVLGGGEVVIKRGGKLIFEENAQIELNGHDAVLALGGLTEIGDNAVFTFGYQGTESGYIRMLKDGYWGERFFVGTNAEVYLKGEGQEDLILYMEKDVDFWEYNGSVPGYTYDSQRFRRVEIADGLVKMEHKARLLLINPSKIENVYFQRTGSGIPRGVVPMSQCDVFDSYFNEVRIEAMLHYLNNGILNIDNSEFRQTTVDVRGQGYAITNSYFGSSQISSRECTKKNKFIKSTISAGSDGFEYPIAISDNSTSELYIYKSNIINSGTGILKSMSRVTAACSNFNDNGVAIHGTDNATINLSSLQGGGHSYFENNNVNIEVTGAYDILLFDGYNEIYDGIYMNMKGVLDRPFDPCPTINANNNIWTPAEGFASDPDHPDATEFDVIVEGAWPEQYCIVQFSFGDVADTRRCVVPVVIEGPNQGKSNADGTLSDYPLITTPQYFNDTPLDEAVIMALFTTTAIDDSLGDDFLAADMYYELLMAEVPSVNDSMDAVVHRLRNNSIFSYKSTIENLFTTELVTPEMNAQSFSPVLADYASVLMAYTDSIKVTDTYREQFQLEMAKTALFKTIEKPELALQIVENLAYCDHDSIQEFILEKQRLNLIYDIASKELGIESYLVDSITFELDSSIFDIPVESFIDSSGFGTYIFDSNVLQFSVCQSYGHGQSKRNGFDGSPIHPTHKVYPNPAEKKLTVWIEPSFIDKSSGYYFFDLYDIHGKRCFSIEIGSGSSDLELPPLNPAMYYYVISHSREIEYRGKLLIVE